MHKKTEILRIIRHDYLMMEVLQTAASLQLPDWWIGAGFVRNKVWDVLYGYKKRTPLNDIDVIYFDPIHLDEKDEKSIEDKLIRLRPDLPWSVKNQARMAMVRGDGPYKNAQDGLSRWIETATCIGVRINKDRKLELATPLGIADLVSLRLRLNKKSGVSNGIFEQRIKEKRWLELWPNLKIVG